MKITKENYVMLAEQTIKSLLEKKNERGKPIKLVTTSKIRNLLAMTVEIYNEAVLCQEKTLPGEFIERINYLKIRFIYEAGRDASVKAFVEDAGIIEVLDEIQGDRESYLLFSHYMEALVAYRKFLGGRDE